jgi:Fe-S-cluster-containing hydrogenase component 2
MISINPQACPQNHACPAVAACPEGAIIQDDISSAPWIDHDLCSECGACTQTCRVFSSVPDMAGVS